MARRATLFATYGNDANTLRIAGPYEFSRANDSGHASPETIQPLFTFYGALKYSLGILPPEKRYAQQALESGLSDAWISLTDRPRIRHMTTDSGQVTVVVFPAGTKPGTPSKKMIQDVVTALNTERQDSRTRLVIGVSPWGKQYEQAFLQTHSGLCDILLGSGPGPGLTSSLSPDRRTLWVRAYSKGRTVSMIEVHRFPSRNPASTWHTGTTITARLMVLDAKVRDNPDMKKILASGHAPSGSPAHTSSCGQ